MGCKVVAESFLGKFLASVIIKGQNGVECWMSRVYDPRRARKKSGYNQGLRFQNNHVSVSSIERGSFGWGIC